MERPSLDLRRVATLALVAAELLIAGFAAALAVVLINSLGDSGSHAHDNEWSPLILGMAGATFLSFGIAALGLATSWRFRWWLQAVPIVTLVTGALFFLLVV